MVRVGNKIIGSGQPCFVIAEIGINHNGKINLAKELIDIAIRAGCDAVKFQKRTVEVVYMPDPNNNYNPGSLDIPRDGVDEGVLRNAILRGVLPLEAVNRLEESKFSNVTNGDLKRALEFSFDEYVEIDRYCRERGILWFASPWDEESVNFIERFNPPCYKVASASLTDRDLLLHIASKGRPVILSTGMSTIDQVHRAASILLPHVELILLHCVAKYPAGAEQLNLRVINTLQRNFPGVPVGYSGHEADIAMSFAAVVMGACVVERHITVNRAMWGSDQSASLEARGIELLVRDIREFEIARGDGVKRILEDEVVVEKKLRRKNTI